MAEMQEKVLADTDTKHQLGAQIVQWEENLERLHCEQFRLRCYMASLQSGELPNPKVSERTHSQIIHQHRYTQYRKCNTRIFPFPFHIKHSIEYTYSANKSLL